MLRGKLFKLLQTRLLPFTSFLFRISPNTFPMSACSNHILLRQQNRGNRFSTSLWALDKNVCLSVFDVTPSEVWHERFSLRWDTLLQTSKRSGCLLSCTCGATGAWKQLPTRKQTLPQHTANFFPPSVCTFSSSDCCVILVGDLKTQTGEFDLWTELLWNRHAKKCKAVKRACWSTGG